MQTSASQIMSVTEDLHIALGDHAEFTQELYGRSESIAKINAQNHNNTVSAIAEVKDFIFHLEKIQSASDKAKEISNETNTAISNGLDLVYKLLGYIGEIEKTTKATVDYMQKFIFSADKISDIVKTVENISKHMELITFNAAIEASRAGLQGKSFSVIASAFRDLTDQTKLEVKGIYDLIDTIHEESTQLSVIINENSLNVRECVEHTNHIASGLNAIETNYREVAGMIDEIQKDADAQGSIAVSIHMSVGEIESNSGKVNEDFLKISNAIKKQKRDMETLNNLGTYLQKASQSLSIFIQDGNYDEDFDKEEILGAAQRVFALFEDTVLKQPGFFEMDAESHKEWLDKLICDAAIESVWSNAANGKFIYSNPPAGISNAKIRPWFIEGMKGQKYISDVYISAITKKPCMTVSMPVMRQNECIGVLGADLKIND